MTAAGKRLIQAANEALAIAEGNAEPRTYEVHAPPPTVDVRSIRRGLNMTQVAFGEYFGFGKARIRDWEQNRTRPAASDRILLATIKFAPDAVIGALAAHAKTTGKAVAKSGPAQRVKEGAAARRPATERGTRTRTSPA